MCRPFGADLPIGRILFPRHHGGIGNILAGAHRREKRSALTAVGEKRLEIERHAGDSVFSPLTNGKGDAAHRVYCDHNIIPFKFIKFLTKMRTDARASQFEHLFVSQYKNLLSVL